MIKASELRIGNLVNVRGEVKAALIIDDDYCRFSNKPGFAYANEDIEGIRLTAEWLERMGWLDVGMGFFKPYGEGNPRRQLVWGADNSLKIMDPAGYVITLSENIQHVHQIQNTYFSLTGEEMKIATNEAV